MKQKITQLWQGCNWLIYLLLPLSWLYRAIIALRDCCYKYGLFNTSNFPVPIIVVGNITVGGTGKTPLVIALAHHLKQQGYSPGIVSRGYGGKARQYPIQVNSDSNSQDIGDEPFLIAKRTQCPVVVDPKRVRAVETILQQCKCDIVISDDGLQHYAMSRNVEIAVIDGSRRFGNGYCLPAGPLREPINRLSKVDFMVANGQAEAEEYAMHLQVGRLINLANPACTKTIADFNQQTVHAVAGIGNPQRFFQTLIAHDIHLIEHAFADHHPYQANDLRFNDKLPIIMTEKDAVKCTRFAADNYWYLEVEAVLAEEFYIRLLAKLNKMSIPQPAN